MSFDCFSETLYGRNLIGLGFVGLIVGSTSATLTLSIKSSNTTSYEFKRDSNFLFSDLSYFYYENFYMYHLLKYSLNYDLYYHLEIILIFFYSVKMN